MSFVVLKERLRFPRLLWETSLSGGFCLRQRRFDVEYALCPDFFAEVSILEQKSDDIRFRPVILIVKENS